MVLKTFRRLKTRMHPDFINDPFWQKGYTFQGMSNGEGQVIEPVKNGIPRHHDEANLEIVENQPSPPGDLVRYCGMHWLKAAPNDSDPIRPFIALQWNPASKTWSHSNAHGTLTGTYDATGCEYVEPIMYPKGD